MSIKPHAILYNVWGTVYLKRWFLTPWSRDGHPKKARRWPNIYIHKIVRSDSMTMHDHPWDNLSIVLWGGYIEHVYARPPIEGLEIPPVVQKRRRMGSIVYRKAECAHRVELHRTKTTTRHFRCKPVEYNGIKYGEHAVRTTFPKDKPCWTLFITWRKRRDWGFWCTEKGSLGTRIAEVWAGGEAHRISFTTTGMLARWMDSATFLKGRE